MCSIKFAKWREHSSLFYPQTISRSQPHTCALILIYAFDFLRYRVIFGLLYTCILIVYDWNTIATCKNIFITKQSYVSIWFGPFFFFQLLHYLSLVTFYIPPSIVHRGISNMYTWKQTKKKTRTIYVGWGWGKGLELL